MRKSALTAGVRNAKKFSLSIFQVSQCEQCIEDINFSNFFGSQITVAIAGPGQAIFHFKNTRKQARLRVYCFAIPRFPIDGLEFVRSHSQSRQVCHGTQDSV